MNDELNDSTEKEPEIGSVYSYLVYGLSLPERALRSTSAMVGGALKESASLLIPQAFRDSRSYGMFVEQMLDFLTQDVGGVESDEASATDVDGYVAKKTVSSFVDLAGLATFHISPLTILAITSDLAYNSTALLRELSEELKKAGVISEGSTIDSTADLLHAVGETAGCTADTFDLPPLSVDGLKETIDRTRDQLARIDPTDVIPHSELEKMWADIHSIADDENANAFEISSAMTMFALEQAGNVAKGALTTARFTGDMLDRHIFDYYWTALDDIQHEGFYKFVGRVSGPYIEAVWMNFSVEQETITGDVLSGKLPGKIWKGFTGWFCGVNPESFDGKKD